MSFLVLIGGGVAQTEASAPGCELVPENLRQAEMIRGLRSRGSVPCLVHDRETVRAHLTTIIDTKIPPEKIAREEILFKAIGLLPETFDYKNGLISLYVSQLGGYYDPEKKHFVMAGWMPAMLQAPIIVHELTHALQDQHFDLETFINHSIGTSDELLARSAVAEGDAMAVMVDASRLAVGQPSIRFDSSVDLVVAQSVLGMRMMPGLEGVPEGLKSLLVFPYTSGLRFAHRRLQVGGYRAIDEAFRSAPRSTEEILHPELFGRANPSFKRFDDSGSLARGGADGAVLHGDVVGEFLLGVVLGGLSGDNAAGARAAAGWGGDRATLIRRPGRPKPTLVWRHAWDTAADAAEFCTLMETIVKRGALSGGRLDCSAGTETVFVRE